MTRSTNEVKRLFELGICNKATEFDPTPEQQEEINTYYRDFITMWPTPRYDKYHSKVREMLRKEYPELLRHPIGEAVKKYLKFKNVPVMDKFNVYLAYSNTIRLAGSDIDDIWLAFNNIVGT